MLPTNYRCAPRVLDAARTLIESSLLRTQKPPLLAATTAAGHRTGRVDREASLIGDSLVVGRGTRQYAEEEEECHRCLCRLMSRWMQRQSVVESMDRVVTSSEEVTKCTIGW